MREPLKAGLARADAAVTLLPADLTGVDPELALALTPTPMLSAHLMAVSPPPAGPQVGFAGIGKPWTVERALQAAGCELAAIGRTSCRERVCQYVSISVGAV